MRRIVSAVVLLMLLALCAAGLSEEKQVVLTFAGDCVLGGNLYQNERKENSITLVREKGYDYPFSGLKEIFAQDDLTIVNLEGTLHDSTRGVVKKGINFRGPTDFANILTASGIEAVSIANNHIADFGKIGAQSTVRALEEAGVPYYGTTEHGSYTWIYEDGDIRIGFAGSSRGTRYGQEEALLAAFRTLREADCDVIIASMHAGGEYIYEHHETQEKLVDFYLRNGADIVVGHHPHVVQGIEERGGALVLYSLGNCAFGGNDTFTDYRAYLARLTLSFTDGAYAGRQLTILPILISGVQPGNDFRPVPALGADAEDILRQIQHDTDFSLSPYVEGVGAAQPFVPAP